MSNDDIQKILLDHEQRIASIESYFSKKDRVELAAKQRSLPDFIIDLRDSDFFREPKTSEETHEELGKKYSCEVNRVAVGLLRLANRKQLRKATKIIDGKKHQAYAW